MMTRNDTRNRASLSRGDALRACWQTEPLLLMSVLPLRKVKREAAALRRPAESERKNRAFSAKRQAVWFERRSISN